MKTTLEVMKGKDFSKFKNELSDVLISTICPIGKKIKRIKKDKALLLTKILNDGTEKARSIAEKKSSRGKKISRFSVTI